jgi:hypothetical protein
VPLLRTAALLITGALLLTACGAPPELGEDPGGEPTPPPSPASTPPPGLPNPVPPGGPGTFGPGGFPEEIAISCESGPGSPEADELLALLRSEGMLAAGVDAEVTEGPLCSGDWQYAVVTVPDRDPLQLVSRGRAGDLELITAGTDVCSVEVRFQAPPGIQGIAACLR